MIADAYDAMTSTRAYRKALPQDVAFQELRDKAGVQFHPACVEALIRAVEKRGEKHGDGFERDAEFDNAPVAGLGSAGLGDLLDGEAAESTLVLDGARAASPIGANARYRRRLAGYDRADQKG